MAADPDQDILDFYNQSQGSSGSPTATMTPDPDQDILDFYNKSHSPTPTATAEPSRSPYTDKAVQDQGSALYKASQFGTGTSIPSTIAGSAVRGFLPGRAMMAAYPIGSVLGAAAVGAARGALVGAAVPVAGETGISEAIGGVIGGLISGGAAAWLAYKAQTAAADVVAPQTIFGSKAEQAQVATHPYAAIAGGGLSFGKPNPMNMYRAAKTLSSAEGRAALVAFTKTHGKGMAPQTVDEVGNVINVGMAGGLNGVFNIKEQIESGHFSPGQLAASVATGFVFNEPWFHKPNPAAAAAAKVIAKGGVPAVGPTAPTAPPGIAAPGVVSPPTPRIPGLLDFEVAGPRTETMRAPEAPLPEAPIPKPGTEGGELNAPEARQVGQGSEQEHIGVSQRQDVSAHPEEVRDAGSEQTGNRGGTGAAETEPITFESDDALAARVTKHADRPAAIAERRKQVIEAVNNLQDGDIIIPSWGDGERYIVDARNRGGPGEIAVYKEGEDKSQSNLITLTHDDQIIKAARTAAETIGGELGKQLAKKKEEEVDPRMARIEQIDQEISDYYDREQLPPAALHKEKKAIEAELQKEHEAGLIEEAQGQQARGGDELLDVVAEHGVPLNDPEVKILQEHFAPKNKYGQEKHRLLATGTGEKLYWGDVFKANAKSMDSLAQLLKRKGFENPDGTPIETRGEAADLINERLRSGKKVYGDEARAQTLEEQSFQDYQGPLYAKQDKGKGMFGGLFGSKDATKEPIAAPGGVEPIKDPETLHNVLEADKGKGVEVVESTGGDNEPGQETLEMGMNRKQIARRLNQDSYKGSIVHTAVKEGLQNVIDAVRAAGATDKNPGKIIINVDYDARTVEIDDRGYGTGMTPKTIREALFTIGGTDKGTSPENTSGGIGVAKIGMFYGAKRVVVDSVRDGLKSHIDATGEQIQDGTFTNIKTRTDEPNGTRLFIEIPRTHIDGYGETKHVYFEHDPLFLKNPLFGPYEVIYNGKTLPVGIHTSGWQKDNVFNFKWGHVDVYVDPRPTETPTYHVMSAGLHQFEVSKYSIFGSGGADRAIKHDMVFDVRSHVKADHPDYPFNNQREGFQGRRDADVQDMWNYLKKQGVEQQLLAAKKDFQKFQVLPELDIEKELTPEDQKVIAGAFTDPKRPTLTGKPQQAKSVTFTPDDVITTGAGGKQTKQSRSTYGVEERTFQPKREVDFEKTKLDVSNLDPSKPYFHNNTNKEYNDIPGAHELIAKLGNTLVKFMRHVGEKFDLIENYGELRDTSPSGWFGGIAFDSSYGGLNMVNPIKAILFNPGDLSAAGLHTPDAAAAETMHTYLHEITHMPQRNEGAGFTWEMKKNYARLKAYKVEYQKYEKILENIYAKHWDAIRLIRERHKSYDTSNRAASFESGSAVREDASKGAGAGEGAPSEHAPEDVSLQEQGRTGTGRAGETDRQPGSLGDILSGQKSGAQPGAEPAHPEVAATPPESQRSPAAAPVPEGVRGIRDTLAGIKEAAAQPPETWEQRKFAPLEVATGESEQRPPTANEAAGPGLRDMSEQEMSKTIESTLQKYHDPGVTDSGTSSGGLSHNDIIDAGREAIRQGVDPEAVANSRAIPPEQKYTVVKAHAEDLREVSEQAEDFARRNPSQMNKDAAEAAFADYSNWDKTHVKPAREMMDQTYPGMPPEEYNPRSMTDLRQEMIRTNDRDFKPGEEMRAAEQTLKEIERTVRARNKELMKRDEELRKASPDLVREIKNGDDLFKYLSEAGAFPCI